MAGVSESVKAALIEGYPKFAEATKQFFDKTLAPGDYKKISGGQGCYGEHGANSVMLRLRFAGGAIDKTQIKFLIDAMKEHPITFTHISTGQSLQLHHLDADTVIDLFPKAHAAGIYTRGAGGDNPRNMTGAPLRGVGKGAAFDVTPYFTAAQNYLMMLVTTLKLPRKYKIAFSSGCENEGHATCKELGFVAEQDGTFTVYAGGGLGANPRVATKVAAGIDPKDVLYYMYAMGKLYEDFGDYKNKARARSRYIVERLGADEFIRVFNEYVANAKETQQLDIVPEVAGVTKQGTGVPTTKRAVEQKQPGLYYVNYHPFGGDPDAKTFLRLLEYIYPLQDVTLRLNTDESMYIINLNAEEADEVAKIVEADNATTDFDTSISCVGCTVCQIGLRDSSGMLAKIRDAVVAAGDVDEALLPQIRVSGCPNSCGAHEVGLLGLQGFSKKVNDAVVPAFALSMDGSCDLHDTKLGNRVAVITEEELPVFFVELGRMLTTAKTPFAPWYAAHKDEFMALVKKFD